ncbi:MAG TPA: polysaccharide biosynthesis/export family protein [Candidatus Acidoferrum sp.]|jgi:protein involved in polysaccharide export with SLBB domain|nr:polysaccharide biosynthesis/export family protein [Candidatus Acidoferrum sp.]
MRTRRAALVAAVVAFTALGGTRADAALHPGDKIDVTVYNHPELSGTRTLDASGNVALPIVGTISALNMEPSALADRLRNRLAPYVRQVAVDVQLNAQSQSIFVAGGPIGVVQYQPGMTLSSVVDLLQSRTLTPAADNANASTVSATSANNLSTGPLDLLNGPINFHKVAIQRDNRTLGTYDLLALRAKGQTGPSLIPNDTIQLVDKPVMVSVQGDVEKPGVAYLTPDEPLSHAIVQVGGTAATSTQSALTLTRGGQKSVVSMGDTVFSQPAQNGDEIVVPRAPRVDVLGNVTKPGETLLRGNTTLVSAIYYAGGPAQYANLKSVEVMHGGQRKVYNLANLQKGGTGDNPNLTDGDVVMVPQGSKFQWSDVWSALGSLGLFGVRL